MAAAASDAETTLRAVWLSPSALQQALLLDQPDDALRQLFGRATAVTLRVPALWPGSDGSQPVSRARVCWNVDDGLLVLYEVGPPFATARDDPKDKMSILRDSRVELFIAPLTDGTPLTRYCGFEMNAHGRVLDFTCTVPRQFDYGWQGNAMMLADWRDSESGQTMLLAQFPWTDFCSDEQLAAIVAYGSAGPCASIDASPRFHVGLYRGEVDAARSTADCTEFIWQSWIDPQSPDVNFHVPATFGTLTLESNPEGAGSAARSSAGSSAELSDVSLIAPGVYQGSMLSLDDATLSCYGISRIVNAAAGEVRPPKGSYNHLPDFSELKLFLDDSLSQDLFNVQSRGAEEGRNLEDGFRFIQTAIAEHRSVLIHCAQGKSRSSAMALFYLCKSRRMHVSDALTLLKAARPVAQPNPSFLTQLERWCAAEEIPVAAGAAASGSNLEKPAAQ